MRRGSFASREWLDLRPSKLWPAPSDSCLFFDVRYRDGACVLFFALACAHLRAQVVSIRCKMERTASPQVRFSVPSHSLDDTILSFVSPSLLGKHPPVARSGYRRLPQFQGSVAQAPQGRARAMPAVAELAEQLSREAEDLLKSVFVARRVVSSR